MMSADECLRYAAECLAIARNLSDPYAKKIMLEMAERWRLLAERQSDRNEPPDRVD